MRSPMAFLKTQMNHHRQKSDTDTTTSNGIQAESTPESKGKSLQAPMGTAPPTVIELFQSQGCSSCPPTNSQVLSLLNKDDPNYLVLTYDVTYWDHLGWEDTLGDKRWNERQWEYARAMKKTRVYTPQVVVNGVSEGVGNSASSLDKVIQKGQQRSMINTKVEMELVDGGLLVSGEIARKSRVLLVRYDPKMSQVQIGRGENGGRTLKHQNVVRNVESLGDWEGGPKMFPMSHETATKHQEQGLERVVLIQEGFGGPMIGATRL